MNIIIQIKSLNQTNADYLKKEIEYKKSGGFKKMTDTEYALNRHILEKIKN